MELLLQSDEWSCLPTAFAMTLGILPKEIYEFIGHDGSEVIWPELDEPYCRRSFSIEEMLDYCIATVYYPVQLSPNPAYCPEQTDRLFQPFLEPEARFAHYLEVKPAVLLGIGKDSGHPHAVAWCHKEQLIFDPSGEKYSIDRFEVESGFFIF
jgi:hypothetical protein